MIYLLQVILLLICVIALYKNTKTTITVLDPGLILVFVLLITVSATIVLFNLFFDKFCLNPWVLCVNKEYVPRIVTLNVWFAVLFTTLYIYGSRQLEKRTANRKAELSEEFYLAYLPLYWLIVVVFVRLFDHLLIAMGLTYIQVYWGNIADLAYLVLYSSLLLSVKGVRLTILTAVLFSMFSMFIYYPLLVSDVYEVNKGGAIKDLVFCMVFLSLVKFPGRLITPVRFFVGLIFLPIFLGVANFVEALVSGSSVNVIDLLIYLFQGYEIQMMENQAYILDAIETGDLSMLYGATYLNAIIDLFYPVSGAKPPSEWYAELITFGTDVESAYGFSFLAEGILNFGIWGLFSTVILSVTILLIIRSILYWNLSLMPVLYAYFITLSYYVYRADLMYVLKKMQFTFISLIVLLVLYTMVRYLVHESAKTLLQKNKLITS